MAAACLPAINECVEVPKTSGTENDALIQLEIEGIDDNDEAEALLACLNQLSWASRTAVLPHYPGVIAKDRLHPKATAVVAVGERQWADAVDLLHRVQATGHEVSAIHLSQYGTLRVHTQFGPISGETIEVTEGKKKRLMLAPTNPARQDIEAAYGRVPWLAEAKFTEAGTKPDFNLAKDAEVRAEFMLGDSQVIELHILLNELRETGYAPKSMRVARMFAGVPFGFPIPGDVELTNSDGANLRSNQLHRSGRPLVLVFFSLTGKYKQGDEEKSYWAEPAHFQSLTNVAMKYADRADFAAIYSPKDDSPADVASLWQRAAIPFPFYCDSEQKLSIALSATLRHPPPHIFVLDATGKLRYTGEFADGWIEPERVNRIYLIEALERVLANQFADNGAVFNNSPACSCSAPGCGCPKCGCGGPCRCGLTTDVG
jgi:hypothetical protein